MCGVLFQCALFAALPLPARGQVSERVAHAPFALAPLPPALPASRRLQPHAAGRGGRRALSPPTALAEEQPGTMTPAGACGCSVGAARPRRRCWRSLVGSAFFLARASDAPPPVVAALRTSYVLTAEGAFAKCAPLHLRCTGKPPVLHAYSCCFLNKLQLLFPSLRTPPPPAGNSAPQGAARPLADNAKDQKQETLKKEREPQKTPEARGTKAVARITSRPTNKPGGRARSRPKPAQQQRCHAARRDGRVVRRITRSAHARRAANRGP